MEGDKDDKDSNEPTSIFHRNHVYTGHYRSHLLLYVMACYSKKFYGFLDLTYQWELMEYNVCTLALFIPVHIWKNASGWCQRNRALCNVESRRVTPLYSTVF